MTIIRLAWSDFIRSVKNSRTLVIILLCAFFFYNQLLGMRELARQYELGITPFVYPMYMTLSRGRMYAIILIAMFMGEAPYYNGAELFISIRINRYKWFAGKLLHILFLSVAFQLAMIIMSVLLCLPYLGISNDWGDVIRTFIMTEQGKVSVDGTIDGAYFLTQNPVVCMLEEFVMMVLLSIIIALLMFILNGIFKNIIGTILVGIAVLIDTYISDLAWLGILHMPYVLPTTWVDLNAFVLGEGLSFGKCTLHMSIMIVVLVMIATILVGKKIIRPVKNV